MAMLGVPYGDAVHRAPEMARAQAAQVAARIGEQGGPTGLEDREVVALIAYMQRLGTDIRGGGTLAQAPASVAPPTPEGAR